MNTLHKLKKINSAIGFTLIEIVVVMSVLMVLMTTTFVGFNQYTRTQRLNSDADNLRTNLNETKSNALSGYIYQCSNTQTLYGYKLNIDTSSSYSLYEICKDNTTGVNQAPRQLTNKKFTLSSGAFDSTSTPVNTSVTFIAITGIPETASTITFKINSGTNSRTITVNPTGIIQ